MPRRKPVNDSSSDDSSSQGNRVFRRNRKDPQPKQLSPWKQAHYFFLENGIAAYEAYREAGEELGLRIKSNLSTICPRTSKKGNIAVNQHILHGMFDDVCKAARTHETYYSSNRPYFNKIATKLHNAFESSGKCDRDWIWIPGDWEANPSLVLLRALYGPGDEWEPDMDDLSGNADVFMQGFWNAAFGEDGDVFSSRKRQEDEAD